MPAFRALCLILTLLVLTACGVDPAAAPTLTPDPALPATAAALFPTPIPTAAPTATPLAESDAAQSIARLVGDLQNAVFTHNTATYLALVDLEADPTFAVEHTRWVEDWNSGPGKLLRFTLAARNLVIAPDGASARADLNVTWSTLDSLQVSRGADYPARFTRGADGRWRYAGEDFAITLETEHFTVRAMAGLEAETEALAADLPAIYAGVTAALDHAPAGQSVIKIYTNPWALIATTRLSLTSEIAGWHEPGEALKITAAATRDEATLAHEFAHALLFDLAGMTRGSYPWWVAEGAAEHAASRFWTGAQRLAQIAAVQERRRTAGLVAWEALAVFEETPERLWPAAYTQGYAFMVYLSAVHGDAARVAWLRELAGGTLEAATQTVFGLDFAALEAGFLAWLDEQ